MSTCDWENRVWMDLPWPELRALGAVAVAWPLAAYAANDPRRPPCKHPRVAATERGHGEDDPT